MENSVLVTGGAGYIGSHVCKALAAGGYRPVVLDDLSTGHRWAVKWGPLVEARIDDRDALQAIVREHRPRAAIHLAAKAYVGESVKDPVTYLDANVRQLTVLLEELRAGGLLGTVFSSSCSIYGTPASVPVTEESAIQPLSPYAHTKAFGEWALRAYDVAYGFRHVALRYFNAAGADPELEIGEVHDPETHLIPNVVKSALGGPRLDIFGSDYPTSDGTCVRDYVHVSDLARAHVLALEHLLKGGESVAVNLGTGVGSTVMQVVDAVETHTGRKVDWQYHPRRAGDATALYASADRAKALFGWTPRVRHPPTHRGDGVRLGGEARASDGVEA